MRPRKLTRWGNGVAIRIPKALLEDAHLREGDKLHLSVRNGAIIARPAKKKPVLKDLLAKISGENVHGEVDWGKPQGKEAW
ncbi:MAG TPA: AbrB/MazE/SpoVT family DNA-binding domain-containing protein [Bryocella sp.]|nr:AbrB/MazE/SpoVT family DNA-binding domain-containing protein [Bryocella sp.]